MGLYDKVSDLLRYLWHGAKKFWQWYKITYHKARWYGKTGIVFASMIVLFFVYLFLVDINFLWLFGKSPSLSDISNPKQDVASMIYSEDGVLLGRYYRENRIPVEYDEINPMMINALIATEDERFYRHLGIVSTTTSGLTCKVWVPPSKTPCCMAKHVAPAQSHSNW